MVAPAATSDEGGTMGNEARVWIEALRTSHDRLAGIVQGLSPAEIEGPSYCDTWSIAQVCSHLGSGAEIHLANLEAMLAGAEMPSREVYQEIWDRWNAKPPAAMAADALESDERHVTRFEGLTDEELAGLAWDFMGRTLDASGIIGLRLGEHAAHTWDVEVVGDPSATIPSSSADLLVKVLPARAGRLARGDKPAAAPTAVAVTTTAPEGRYLLRLGDEVALEAGDASGAAGHLSTTGEALFRLVYGRLDAAHTPAGTTAEGPVSLDELRRLFPGF